MGRPFCRASRAIVLALAVGLVACGSGRRLVLGGRPPVVVVLIDTLRADRLGAYGYARPTSPSFDALAPESVLFDDAQTPAPWTLPAVVSALTSTWPTEHGVLRWGQKIAPDLRPLAVRLRRAGYATAAFVANPLAGRASGLDAGYDTVVNSHSTVDLGAVGAWLEAHGGGPFFLYLHSTEPHIPYAAPPESFVRIGPPPADRPALVSELYRYRGLTRLAGGRVEDLPPERREEQRALLARLEGRRADIDRLYDASVAWADANLGALVALLRERGLLDRCVLVVLSDHGEEILEHGGLLHGQSLYGELTRVPLLWRLPRAASAGSRIPEPVTLVDLVPTLLELLGTDDAHDSALRGRSFADLLGGARRPEDEPLVTSVRLERAFAYATAAERGNFNLAAVQGPWKGIWNVEPGGFELYERAEDPREARDRAASEPARAARLRAALDGWLRERSGWRGPQDGAPDASDALTPAERERLRALGYLE